MKEMMTKQKQEEKDLILLMRDNKRLAEHLSKVEEEIAEKKKKMKHSAMKKVLLSYNTDLYTYICCYLLICLACAFVEYWTLT